MAEIVQSQKDFADVMRPVSVRKMCDSEPANKGEIGAFRGLVGSGFWLSGQTRPDLAVLVAVAQSMLPSPTVENVRRANALSRRARQLSHLSITFHPIAPRNLVLCVPSDSSLNVAKPKKGTQAGWIVGITDRSLADGEAVPWTPLTWRSFRHKSPVASTFSVETKALSGGLGRPEWCLAFLCEMLEADVFDLRDREAMYSRRAGQAVVDCKSVYDHVKCKPRLCMAGHQDPDLCEMMEQGDLSSPTISNVARALAIQVICSMGWILQLGDIRGAFLESPELERPLFFRPPREGLSGVPEGCL